MPTSEYIERIRAKIGNDLLILTGTSAVIVNSHNEVLLQLRSDLPIWTLLGGYLDPGEDIADGIIREVREEAGITVVPERIAAVLSGPDHFHTYDNGHQVAIINICFRCRPADDTCASLERRRVSRCALLSRRRPARRFVPLAQNAHRKGIGQRRSCLFSPAIHINGAKVLPIQAAEPIARRAEHSAYPPDLI